MLFLARRSGITPRDVDRSVRQRAIGEHPPRWLRHAWDSWAREHGDPVSTLLREFAQLGAVTLPRDPDGTVEMTPLAQWAMREQFLLDRISVPALAAPSPRMSAADLVALAGAVSDAEFDQAFAPWISGRDADRSARELLMYAASSRPRERLIAVGTARRIGALAQDAWSDAMRLPEVRGYALIALSVLAGDQPGSAVAPPPDPGDMAGIATDLIAMAGGADDPDLDEILAAFAEAVPPGTEAWVLGLMARTAHPAAERLLEVLGSYHPDRQVARDARKGARAMARNRRRARRHRNRETRP
jgi:hypothetical protein